MLIRSTDRFYAFSMIDQFTDKLVHVAQAIRETAIVFGAVHR